GGQERIDLHYARDAGWGRIVIIASAVRPDPTEAMSNESSDPIRLNSEIIMDPANPYASPSAETTRAKVASKRNLTWLLFSFRDRISRRTYWTASIGVVI